MSKLHVKTGDTVYVVSGKSKGKRGKVLVTSPKEGKVIVEGVNIVTKHVKPKTSSSRGEIVKTEGALYACKVQLYCEVQNRRARRPQDPSTTAKRSAIAENAARNSIKGI